MFLAGLLNVLEKFFSKYNYKTLSFYLYDNFVPSFLIPFVDTSFELLTSLLAVSLALTTPFYFAYSVYVESFLTLETSITHATNHIVAKAVSIALKFLLCIAVLIFVRGGIPRFRFDYLTRLGWIRFLSLVLLSFIIELFLLSML